jgi:Phage gp6-like head-tail connector protein
VILPPLLTLEDAKVHLRITDTAHDVDVQQKLTEAQDVIVDYLGEQVDPLWTDTTAPPRVLSAIKIYLTHLYEQRGDDMASDMALWDAIRRLLARTRLQAIGVPETTDAA